MAQVMKLRDFATRTDEVISATVRALASGRGVSPEVVAANIGITKSAMYSKLKGQSTWKASEVVSLSRFFDVRLTDLFDGLGGRFGPQDPNSPAAWAPRGSNPEPTDYKFPGLDAVGGEVVSLDERRAQRNTDHEPAAAV